MLRCLWQMYEFLTIREALLQECEIFLAHLDEILSFFELCQATRGLHVCDLKVVPEVTVCIFMVIPFRKPTQLPTKSLTACIVFSRRTVAVSPPITETLCNCFQLIAVGENSPTLTHGNVMCRIKAKRRDVSKGTNHLSTVSAPQRVTTILNEPKPIFFT